MIVDDQLYYLTATTKVERDDGRTASIADLVRRQSVGLDVVVEEGRYLVVKRVRILRE